MITTFAPRRPFDESRVKRDKGRFAKKVGSGATTSTPSDNDRANPEATVFKPHEDGAVTHVSDDGQQRLVYNADTGEFIREVRDPGGPWEQFKTYDKNGAHTLIKSGGWSVAEAEDQDDSESVTDVSDDAPDVVDEDTSVNVVPDVTPNSAPGYYDNDAYILVRDGFPTRDGGEMSDVQAEMLWLNPPRLTSEQKIAIDDYSKSGYKAMNDCLRTGQNCTSEATTTTEHLRESMRPLGRNVTVFRATNLEHLGGAQYLDDLESLVGSEISDSGFISTSLDPAVSDTFGDVAMQIEVPEGASALFPGSLSSRPSELELILAPDTRFRVVEVVRNTPSGRPAVRLEVIL